MRVLHIATVGEDIAPVLVGIREFPVTKIILLYTEDARALVNDLEARLKEVMIPTETRLVTGDPVVRVMELVAEIVREDSLHYDDILFNVSSGSKMLSCAGLSAAFVNGIKAFGATKEGVFQLPVLKFSYAELISEPKVKILRALREMNDAADSLGTLETRAGVEKSLLSYHIRGGRESKGLEELGLVRVDRGEHGKLVIHLTGLGRLVLTGR